MKNKKIVIISAIIGLLLIGGIVYLTISLQQQKQANKDMQELAELDKRKWRMSISSLPISTVR